MVAAPLKCPEDLFNTIFVHPVRGDSQPVRVAVLHTICRLAMCKDAVGIMYVYVVLAMGTPFSGVSNERSDTAFSRKSRIDSC